MYLDLDHTPKQPTLESVERLNEVIGMESAAFISTVGAKAISFTKAKGTELPGKLRNFSDSLTVVVNGISSSLFTKTAHGAVKPKKLSKLLDKVLYVDIRETPFPAPMGLKVELEVLVSALKSGAPIIDDTLSAIEEVYGYMGEMLGDPARLSEVKAASEFNIPAIDGILSKFKDAVDRNDNTSMLPFGKQYKSNGDAISVAGALVDVSKAVSKANPAKVNSMAQKLYVRLEKLSKVIEKKEEKLSISPANFKTLSEISLELAKCVEVVGLISYYTTVTTTAVEAQCDKLEKIK